MSGKWLSNDPSIHHVHVDRITQFWCGEGGGGGGAGGRSGAISLASGRVHVVVQSADSVVSVRKSSSYCTSCDTYYILLYCCRVCV